MTPQEKDVLFYSTLLNSSSLISSTVDSSTDTSSREWTFEKFLHLDSTNRMKNSTPEDEWQDYIHQMSEGKNELERELEQYIEQKKRIVETFPGVVQRAVDQSNSILTEFQTSVDCQLQDSLETIQENQAPINALAKIIQPLAKKLVTLDHKRTYVEQFIQAERLSQRARNEIEKTKNPIEGLNAFFQLALFSRNLSDEYSELKMTIQARVEYLAKALRNHSENGLKEALKEISWPQPFPNAANEKQQAQLDKVCESFLHLLQVQVALSRQEDHPMDKISAQTNADEGASTDDMPLWAMNCLLTPLITRMRFHFESSSNHDANSRTSRLDKPEWIFYFIKNLLDEHSDLLEQHIQPLLIEAGIGGCDVQSRFLRGLISTVNDILKKNMDIYIEDSTLFCHVVDEILAFERHIEGKYSYSLWTTPNNRNRWPRCIYTLLPYINQWIQVDLQFSLDRFHAVVDQSPDAWDIAHANVMAGDDMPAVLGSQEQDQLQCTNSVYSIASILRIIQERFELIPDTRDQLMFVKNVQQPIVQKYTFAVASIAKSCKVKECVKYPEEKKWRQFCGALSSCEFLAKLLADWGETIFYLELQHEAAQIQLCTSYTAEAKKVLLSTISSLSERTVPAQQLNTVLTSVVESEEATAVANAVRGPAAMIGPSAALAAFSSIFETAVSPTLRRMSMENILAEKIEETSAIVEDDTVENQNVQEEELDQSTEGEASSSSIFLEKFVSSTMDGLLNKEGDLILDDTQDPTFNDSTIFEKEITTLNALVEAILGDAVDAVVHSFQASIWQYRLSPVWDLTGSMLSMTEHDNDDYLDLSPELSTGLNVLRRQLISVKHLLNESTTAPTFWRNIADRIDVYLYEKVIWKRRFSPHGIRQLEFDMNVITSIFKQVTSVALKRYFARSMESVILLSLPKSKALEIQLAIADEASMNDENDSVQLVTILEACGVFRLTLAQAQTLFQHRMDLQS